MSAHLEALATPSLDKEGRPKAVVRPMSLAMASPTIGLLSWTVEG